MNAAESQQVAGNFCTCQWERFRNFWRAFISFCFRKSDVTDGGSACSRPWRCVFGMFLRLFKRKQREVKIYPRLELPPNNLEFEYNMQHKNRGIAMIFNQKKFRRNDRSARIGTEIDRDRLRVVLEDLNFEVKVFNDLRSADVIQELEKVAAFDHRDNDCLIVTIMTHGTDNMVSAYDEDYSIERVTSAFNDENCPSLGGKPKLFFIQACRGALYDSGHVRNVSGDSKDIFHTLHRDHGSHESIDVNPFSPQIEIEKEVEAEGIEDIFYNPPIFKDCLMVRSTMSKHFSFRNTDTGSWFIQDLCQELEANGTKSDILNILTHVNWSVSERKSVGHYIKDKKQILCISSMLTKNLIFNYKTQT